jgi:hypothetical protein
MPFRARRTTDGGLVRRVFVGRDDSRSLLRTTGPVGDVTKASKRLLRGELDLGGGKQHSGQQGSLKRIKASHVQTSTAGD